jgi:D-inositol-3-phosphate glycosyltransferase
MKALYIPALPRNPELRPKETRPTTILGARVFGWTALCALLTYGTYDKYLVPGFTDQQRNELIEDGLAPDSASRLVPVPAGNNWPTDDSDQFVLATMGPELRTLAATRHRFHFNCVPLCGFIHSINSARTVFNILQQYFAGLCEYDLLLCSSRAGMKTIETYLENIDQLLPPTLRYRARRVLVPLGVNIPAENQENRLALRERLSLGPDHTVGLYFGRLSQMSKADLGPLLLALSVLSRGGTVLHLVIAGDDTQMNEAPRLTALAAELNCLTNLTVWTDPSADEKHLLYSGADIFVSPSDNIQETFGLSVAEALAYGLPTVVSDWGGYRDLVTDGETGFLVRSLLPPNIGRLRLADCTNSMADEDLLAQSTTIDFTMLCEKLEKLVRDPALRKKMGCSGRQFANHNLSWRVIVGRYEELWQESRQMAKAARRRGISGNTILGFSLENIFGHFASEKRSSGSECFITEEGREWLKRPDRFYFLCPVNGRLSPQHFGDLLGIIAERPGISVEMVVDLLCSKCLRTSVDDTHWALARLFKYGLVKSLERRQPHF